MVLPVDLDFEIGIVLDRGVVFFGSESLRRPAEERTDMMALI